MTIYMKPASKADDIRCADGELVGCDYMFDNGLPLQPHDPALPEQAPEVSFKAQVRALPPYCHIDGEMPTMTVSAQAEKIQQAVQEKFREFLAAVKAAGLHFHPVKAAACWVLDDGSLWQLSEPVDVGADLPESTIRTIASETRDGVTYVTVQITRSPFEVVCSRSDVKVIVCEEGEEMPEVPGYTPEPDAMIAVKTRPIKLGDPFAIKKLKEVEAIWPDGSLLPLKVYGALRLGKWYFLGLAPKGRMLTRGSGFRYFRIETYALRRRGGYLLPTVKVELTT